MKGKIWNIILLHVFVSNCVQISRSGATGSEPYSTPGCGKIDESLAGVDSRAAVPWAAAIFFLSTQCDFRPGGFGNGVIIGPTTVLMSGNFLWSSNQKSFSSLFGFKPSNFMVGVGLKSKVSIKTDTFSQFLKVSSIQPHYKSYEKYSKFDYALVHLQSPIQFSTRVRPICIETLPHANFTGVNSTFLQNPLFLGGFNSQTNELQRAPFHLKGSDFCRTKLTTNFHTSQVAGLLTKTPCGLASVSPTVMGFSIPGTPQSPQTFQEEDISLRLNIDMQVVERRLILNNICLQKGSALVTKKNDRWFLAALVTESLGYDCYKNLYFVSLITMKAELRWLLQGLQNSPISYICNNGQQVSNQRDICNTFKDCDDASDENQQYCDAIKCRRYSQYCNRCPELKEAFQLQMKTFNFSSGASSAEVRCPPINAPHGAVVYCEDAVLKERISCRDGADIGTKAVFRCKKYDVFNPNPTSYCVITCQRDGKWTEGLSRLHCEQTGTVEAASMRPSTDLKEDDRNFTNWAESILEADLGHKKTSTEVTSTEFDDEEFQFNSGRPSSSQRNSTCSALRTKPGVQMTCRHPTTSQIVDCKHASSDVTVEFTCEQYYKPLLGTTSLVKKCQPNGHWTLENRNFECRLDCGVPKSNLVGHIVNGVISDGTKWPWHAIMFVKPSTNGNYSYICGATLVSKQIVITAAHCVTRSGKSASVDSFKIILGAATNDFDENKEDPNVQIFNVKNITTNPAFNYRTFEADIAVIQLSHPVEINDFIRPACLPTSTSQHIELLHTSPGSIGKIVGFGLDETGKPSKVIRETSLPVVSYSDCFNVLKIHPSSSMYCAGFTNGTSACNGDSGGGMFFEDDAHLTRLYLQGIVSHGNPDTNTRLCDSNQYTVFTKVGSFKNWVFDLGVQMDDDFP